MNKDWKSVAIVYRSEKECYWERKKMNPWRIWILFTYRRAKAKSIEDVIVYGVGTIERRWWGWKRLTPFERLDEK